MDRRSEEYLKSIKLTEHFNAWEMRCRCERPECDALPMRFDYMCKLEIMRIIWNKPMVPTSATRCRLHNKAVGGEDFSEHVFANATDWLFEDEDEKMAFVKLAEKVGFKGIGYGMPGVGKVHLDNRKHKARWRYQ